VAKEQNNFDTKPYKVKKVTLDFLRRGPRGLPSEYRSYLPNIEIRPTPENRLLRKALFICLREYLAAGAPAFKPVEGDWLEDHEKKYTKPLQTKLFRKAIEITMYLTIRTPQVPNSRKRAHETLIDSETIVISSDSESDDEEVETMNYRRRRMRGNEEVGEPMGDNDHEWIILPIHQRNEIAVKWKNATMTMINLNLVLHMALRSGLEYGQDCLEALAMLRRSKLRKAYPWEKELMLMEPRLLVSKSHSYFFFILFSIFY
jgi:hypothetical protein